MFKSQLLTQKAEYALHQAKQQGAHHAEIDISASQGFSMGVRMGELETLEHDNTQSMSIGVLVNQAKGSASTSDLSDEAIATAVKQAVSMAQFTQADEYSGLADRDDLAWDAPDLDLCHPWNVSMNSAIEQAQQCEQAALDYDARIQNSEGANVHSHKGITVYGNSLGFIHAYQGTRHGINCSVLAQSKNNEQGSGDMQRDYWYSNARQSSDLMDAVALGEKAAQRAVARLNPQSLKTQTVPVIFVPELSPSLIGYALSAIRGGAIYRKASFLLDKLDTRVFPDGLDIFEKPHQLGGSHSAPHDYDGVKTQSRHWFKDGVLQSYALDVYAANRLGLRTTGNAGGYRNISTSGRLHIDGGLDTLIKQMHRGVVITEMMGSGVNTITGDYSRGASGFWVDNGVIQCPVSGITVAGNLNDMYARIQAIGSDANPHNNLSVGSVLMDAVTVAGDGR